MSNTLHVYIIMIPVDLMICVVIEQCSYSTKHHLQATALFNIMMPSHACTGNSM